MNEEKIKQILINNSLSWDKTESQDRAEIYVDDFVKELLEAITVIPCCTELPIYMTYDNSDSEVFAAFTDKERCEQESQECGVPMQKTTLYFGKRK